MCRPRHKEAGVKSAHRQRPRSTRTPVHADPLCACPTPHPGIYRGALRTCCTITCTVATCCYPISFITSIMIIQACATIHRRRGLQQLEPRPRCVPCGKCRAQAEDAWHAIATVSAAICQRLLPLFWILLAGTTRVRAVRIVASERADCVKDRSPRTKVLSEDTDSLHGYPSQYQHHNEDPLESLPCPCPRIRLTRRICSFLCCHEQQVTKYFLAGITSPPKKKSSTMGVRRDWHGVLLMAAALSIASAKPTAGVFWHLYCAVCTSESPPQNWRHHVSFDVCHAGSQKSSHRCGRWTHTTSAVRVNYYREVSSDHVSLGKDSSKYCVFGWYYQIPPPTVSQMCREGCSTVSPCGCLFVWQLAT